MRPCFFAHPAPIFIEGNIAHPVDSIFDRPVVAVEGKQPGGVRLLWGETGDSVNHLATLVLSVEIGDGAFQAKDLGQIGELAVSDQVGAGPDGSGFDAAMALCGLSVLRGEKSSDRAVGCLS